MDFERNWVVVGPLDLGLSLRTVLPESSALLREVAGTFTYTLHCGEGPATVSVRHRDGVVHAEALGPGASAALDAVPGTIGLDDDPSVFSPEAGLVRELHRRYRGLRLGATGRVFDAIIPTVIGQRVTREEARRSYERLIRLVGERAPGGGEMLLPPIPEAVLSLHFDDFLALGIERSRARILRAVARHAARLEETTTMSCDAARARLEAVPGVGPWTSAQVMGVAWGDQDAIPTGDFHLPNTVAWALARESRATDARMLQLLEPYRPQRRRALVLIKLSRIRAPRYGPRAPKSIISRGRRS